MSHQRYPSHEVKEPHSVSLKVLRLSRPSLVAQFPLQPPFSSSSASTIATAAHHHPPPIPASLAYSPITRKRSDDDDDDHAEPTTKTSSSFTNPDPFILSPILNLPPSFGSAYVGETFSCTLCANHDIPPPIDGGPPLSHKTIRDVRIDAEMKTPAGVLTKLDLLPVSSSGASAAAATSAASARPPAAAGGTADESQRSKATTTTAGVDLSPNGTLQKILSFDLKEEGNHVLAVTVSYYEATDMSGRTRTFRKLYQFICKGSLIVRTKAQALGSSSSSSNNNNNNKEGGGIGGSSSKRRKWILEAQLENCSEDAMQLERVGLGLEKGLGYRDCNFWGGGDHGDGDHEDGESRKPVVKPGEVEQVCFVIEEEGDDGVQADADGRVGFGVLQIGWRGEMGNRGFLSTGRLGVKVA